MTLAAILIKKFFLNYIKNLLNLVYLKIVTIKSSYLEGLKYNLDLRSMLITKMGVRMLTMF